MGVRHYSDGQAFWHEVALPLCAQPVRNNVFAGVANRIRKETRKDIFRAGVFDGRRWCWVRFGCHRTG